MSGGWLPGLLKIGGADQPSAAEIAAKPADFPASCASLRKVRQSLKSDVEVSYFALAELVVVQPLPLAQSGFGSVSVRLQLLPIIIAAAG